MTQQTVTTIERTCNLVISLALALGLLGLGAALVYVVDYFGGLGIALGFAFPLALVGGALVWVLVDQKRHGVTA